MKQEIEHLEKEIVKYVIAALSYPRTYMYKKPGEQQYRFFKDIEKSTKFLDRQDAIDTIKMYQRFTGDNQLELVVIPLKVKYIMIEEKYDN